MKFVRLLCGTSALVALVAFVLVAANRPVHAYQDSPATVARPGADITDAYLFPSPTNPDHVVVVMDVHPLIAQGKGLSTFFDQGVLYQMKFSNQLPTAVGTPPTENLVIQFSVGQVLNNSQEIFVYGPAAPNSAGTTNSLINGGAASGSGIINRSFSVSSGNGMTVFAGARRDPTFFNRARFLQIFPDRNAGSTAQSCLPGGTNTCPAGFNTPPIADTTGQTNVLSFVVELPKATLQGTGSAKIAYWATTSTASGH
jgi:hypothetical protein